MTEVVVKMSMLLCAFLDTAKSRKSAVETIKAFYGTEDDPIPDAVAVQIVEAYYAQHGPKPWLRTKTRGQT